MRAYIIVSGSLFGLLVIAHLVRLRTEPHLIRDPFFLIASVLAAGLTFWAWRLVRRPGGR